jgi:6-pyruvoyltetrahydropterin/6-carboxytetrahydropterin synthase
MEYRVTKTYGAERGLSACFRQWRATDTHCRFLHGYALGFRIVFAAFDLDHRNWVYSFGDCKWIKQLLEETFDHKTVVAVDDPFIPELERLEEAGVLQLTYMHKVGCEAFAEWLMYKIKSRVATETLDRVRVVSVECFEHSANSAEVRS